MNIFSVIDLAQAANPAAEVTVRSGGKGQIVITWQWDGRFLNRRYCRTRATNFRLGEYEFWKLAFCAAGELMGEVA